MLPQLNFLLPKSIIFDVAEGDIDVATIGVDVTAIDVITIQKFINDVTFYQQLFLI